MSSSSVVGAPCAPVPDVRGRPRDPSCDLAIDEAARRLLAERGFTGTSMEAIARTAGIGKDTLYRRFSSKELLIQHLLATAVQRGIRPPDLGGDPRLGLFVYLQDVMRLLSRSDFGPIIAGLVGESSRNPAMAQTFRTFWSDRRAVVGELIDRVVDDLTPDRRALVADQLMGPIYYRYLLSGDPIDDEYLWDLVVAVPWPTGWPDTMSASQLDPPPPPHSPPTSSGDES